MPVNNRQVIQHFKGSVIVRLYAMSLSLFAKIVNVRGSTLRAVVLGSLQIYQY